MNRRLVTCITRGDQTFRVSTADRESSAVLAPRPYAETIAWIPNDDGTIREIVGMDSGPAGSVESHFRVCRKLYGDGTMDETE